MYDYTLNLLTQSVKRGIVIVAENGNAIFFSTMTFIFVTLATAVMTQNDRGTVPKRQGSDLAPQPKWAVFQILNYVILAIFVSSVTYVAVNYRASSGTDSSLKNMFLPLALLWGMCLAYFFGFFGISFLDANEINSDDESSPLDSASSSPIPSSEPQPPSIASSSSSISASSAPASDNSDLPLKSQPRNDTAICAEKCVDSKTITNNSNNTESTACCSSSSKPHFPSLSDDEILQHLLSGSLKDHQLERELADFERAVKLRRMLYNHILGGGCGGGKDTLKGIPYTGYDYSQVFGSNCEIVLGYIPIPCGIVGPLLLNGENIFVPMATTEGCLVASTNRGCKAISASGGCQSVLIKDGITRAPCIRMPSALQAAAVKAWLEIPENYAIVEEAFNSTSSFGRLESVDATIAGRNVYLRFSCMSGDAMGMNIVSKGCLKAIEKLEEVFPDLELVAISGNMCTDKKPSAVNWLLGRGKSIVVEAVIPESVVKNVLKTSVKAMIDTNIQKNLVGSAMAGSIGGFNAHAANIVTAIYLATGQDPAQNVESSNCITLMEYANDGKSLYVSVTMPSIEVGTVGGGTTLPAQASCLEICGVKGATSLQNGGKPGDNSRRLAQIVGATVLAGELSLMAALAANHLVRSHMIHNRKASDSNVKEVN